MLPLMVTGVYALHKDIFWYSLKKWAKENGMIKENTKISLHLMGNKYLDCGLTWWWLVTTKMCNLERGYLVLHNGDLK